MGHPQVRPLLLTWSPVSASEGQVATHLLTCPFNLRLEHRREERSPRARELVAAIGERVRDKRESEWFIQ